MIVSRLAPSPTGAQHPGNARTYLIAWLWVRSQGGHLRLRIEDIDSPRVRPEAVASLFDDLRWLGLDFDGEPVVQTHRLPLYRAALDELRGRELVYPCTCTRSDIADSASAPHAEREGPVYPGTCAGRRATDADGLGDRPYAWRFRATRSPTFVDRFVGETAIDLRAVGGDFVVWKSSDTPAYQLAVAVDDADMGITDVIRGDDLLVSTPRQILLYEALGLRPPRFMHVPLVVGEDGRRLAKRHGDTRLTALRARGVSAETLIGWLGWSCGWLPEPRATTAKGLLAAFDMTKVPRAPVTFRDGDLR